MAGRKENLKSLFSNTRTRVIIIFTVIVLLIAVIVGYVKITSIATGPTASADLTSGPRGIQSIPGVQNQTPQYAKIQEEQNIAQAIAAEKNNTSAIPTLISVQAIQQGVDIVGPKTGVGFQTLIREDQDGAQKSLWIQSLKDANCSKSALEKVLSQGAQLVELTDACSCTQFKNAGFSLADLVPVCTCKELKASGFSARQLKEIGYTAGRLYECGFVACETRGAEFTAQEMKDGGFSDGELKGSGFSDDEIAKAIALPKGITASDVRPEGCDEASLRKLRDAGVTAAAIKRMRGCSAQQLKAAGYTAQNLKDAGFSAKELKDAGFSAKELKDAGFSAKELKDAGFSAKELKDAGFSAKELKDAGFSAKELKDAGFSAAELKAAGFTPAELKAAGFTAAELKAAGFGADELLNAGFTQQDLRNAGFSIDSQVAGLNALSLQQQSSSIPGGPKLTPQEAQAAANSQQLQSILDKQNQQAAEQKYQQKIQQKTSEMLSAANQSIQGWRTVATQVYTAGNEEEAKTAGAQGNVIPGVANPNNRNAVVSADMAGGRQKTVVKTGDILFAVMDTAVNSDEPGPILATIVSGKLKGSKLIGSFNLPSNADKMVITFNTLSVPGLDKTVSISAYAIDPNTARTALSSRTNHHYMMRYGSMFAASFLQGFGNAFQSANTQVTIGGTGGGNNITVSNGIGRSTLENAVIGLATVGKAWGQQAQQIFNTPTTVQVYSGTGLGVLFTQDVKIA